MLSLHVSSWLVKSGFTVELAGHTKASQTDFHVVRLKLDPDGLSAEPLRDGASGERDSKRQADSACLDCSERLSVMDHFPTLYGFNACPK